MTRQLFDSGGGRPLLDIASYARRGPSRRDRLSQDEIELISRTVRRTPEVMVKVLSRGGQDLKAVSGHLAYLNREGDVEIETDDGQLLSGKGVERGLLEDWDLDLEEHRRKADLETRSSRPPPKLVHKLMFSMPAGTPPGKVLAAVKKFAREEFALKHRYAMVLHTDEPHPHVHVVVKAVSEQGLRLNIRKATLREWRREFARHLRAQGVSANATERAVRGVTRTHKLDGIYRAMHDANRHSTHMQRRAHEAARAIRQNRVSMEPTDILLRATRNEVEAGWHVVRKIIAREGDSELAVSVSRFVEQMSPPLTDQELITAQMIRYMNDKQIRDRPPPAR